MLYASYRIVQRQDNIAMPLIHKNIKALIFYLDRIMLTAECALRLVAVGVEPVLNELPELLLATKDQPLITPTVKSLFTGSVSSV